MTATLGQVIDALRDELQQYGEMLALLEAQQESFAQHEPGPVLNSISALETQSSAIEAARRIRETHQQQLAWTLRRPDSGTFQELLPLLPDEYRPLVGALVQEINQLLGRVRQIAALNHAQLQRSVEMMERFLSGISHQAESNLLPVQTSPSDGEPSLRPSSSAVR